MAFRFEELIVWQKALEFSNEIDLITKKFPKEELYSLASQMKRAADSVVLNIALRSGIEVVACLFISKTRLYIKDEVFNNYYEKYEMLCKMITKLRNSM